jgi:hypothetical protein
VVQLVSIAPGLPAGRWLGAAEDLGKDVGVATPAHGEIESLEPVANILGLGLGLAARLRSKPIVALALLGLG